MGPKPWRLARSPGRHTPSTFGGCEFRPFMHYYSLIPPPFFPVSRCPDIVSRSCCPDVLGDLKLTCTCLFLSRQRPRYTLLCPSSLAPPSFEPSTFRQPIELLIHTSHPHKTQSSSNTTEICDQVRGEVKRLNQELEAQASKFEVLANTAMSLKSPSP